MWPMPKRCPRHTQGICSPLPVSLLLLVAGMNASVGPSTVLAASEQPPNILLIVVDDPSLFNLRVYNADSVLDTPVIDRLAAEGMTIDCAMSHGFLKRGCLLSVTPHDHVGANRLAPAR